MILPVTDHIISDISETSSVIISDISETSSVRNLYRSFIKSHSIFIGVLVDIILGSHIFIVL